VSAPGIGNGQAVGAIRKYYDYRVANGLTLGTLVWFPSYGDDNADFDFKIVTVYAGPRVWRDAGQWFVDNAAYRTCNDIGEGILDCDEARMYTGTKLMNNPSWYQWQYLVGAASQACRPFSCGLVRPSRWNFGR
jgi:hypothetical protein